MRELAVEIEDFRWSHLVVVRGECWLWRVPPDYKYPYAQIKGTAVHRLVYMAEVGGIRAGMSIDHICHNTLCVRPTHLREVTHQQNMENRKGAHKNNRTGVRGVSITRAGTYQVRVSRNRKTYCLGTFTSLEEAGTVAKEARQKLHTHSSN